MLRVTWQTRASRFANCFAICNPESAYNLWLTLTHTPANRGDSPVNVLVRDLNGNLVDTSKGMAEFQASRNTSRG